jgi:hypothetical protein
MGISGGPYIVRDSSLILELDAADKNSYSGSGTNWNDLTTNLYTGSLVNGPTFSSANQGSIVFDQTNDYATYQNNPALNDLSGSTWSIWMKITQTTSLTSTSILYKSDNDNTAGWYISINPLYGGLGVHIVSTSNRRYYLPVSQTPAINTWFMYTATWDGTITGTTGINLYINGVLNSTTPQTNNAGVLPHTTDAGQLLDIGNSRTGIPYFFGGNIANIQIYNRALTATEVFQNYNAQKTRFGL